jgi:hypothetical protein
MSAFGGKSGHRGFKVPYLPLTLSGHVLERLRPGFRGVGTVYWSGCGIGASDVGGATGAGDDGGAIGVGLRAGARRFGGGAGIFPRISWLEACSLVISRAIWS